MSVISTENKLTINISSTAVKLHCKEFKMVQTTSKMWIESLTKIKIWLFDINL